MKSGAGETVERLWSVGQVADQLGVSKRAVERMIAAGQLAKVKIGRCTRVPLSSVSAFIDRRLQKAGA